MRRLISCEGIKRSARGQYWEKVVDKEAYQRHTPYDYRPGVWRRIYVSPELPIFLAGIGLATFYALFIYVIGDWWTKGFNALIAITLGHLFIGRAAGMLAGYAEDLPNWMVLGANMVLETSMVLVFFALFVFSYKQLFIFKPLKKALARARRAAIARHKVVARYGIPGLFLFVWLPFWMTGPAVGCAIGFLMGLRNWVNLTIVLVGAYVATIFWGYFLENLTEQVQAWGRYAPWVLIGIIALIVIILRLRKAVRKKTARGP